MVREGELSQDFVFNYRMRKNPTKNQEMPPELGWTLGSSMQEFGVMYKQPWLDVEMHLHLHYICGCDPAIGTPSDLFLLH